MKILHTVNKFWYFIFILTYSCRWVHVVQSSWQSFQIFTEKNMLIITDPQSKSPHPHLLSVWRSLTPLVSPASSLQHYTVTMLALLISRQFGVIREHCSFVLLIVFTFGLHKALERETPIHPVTVHELKRWKKHTVPSLGWCVKKNAHMWRKSTLVTDDMFNSAVVWNKDVLQSWCTRSLYLMLCKEKL